MAKIIQNADLAPATLLTPDERSWVYNALDCCVTHEVHSKIRTQLNNKTQGVYNLSRDLRAPILDMTMRGILVDQRRREKVLTAYIEEEERLEANLNRITKEGIGFGFINPRSPDQVKELLYDYMQLPVQKAKNANGRFTPTTSRPALEKLLGHFIAQPVVSHILAIRDTRKKIGFLKTGIDTDGRMRASFNIAGTKTGRLASSMSEYGTGTNLQNIDRLLRSIFIADPGMKFCNVDLEQADSRNIGAVCWNLFAEEDEAFAGSYLNACESDDLHTTVTRMARPDLEWTDDPSGWRSIANATAYRDKSFRDLSKALGHGSNYYGKPRTMAIHAKLETKVAEEFQRNYFAAFPCIPAMHKDTEAQLRETSCITTILNRQRYFFGRANDDKTLRDAIAFRGQSPTADEINRGMIQLWRLNICQLLLQVHDSILVQYPEELEDEIVPQICEALRVPIMLEKGREFVVPVEAKVGWNYGDFSEDNPDGLEKYKGGDNRTRAYKQQKRWSLWEL